MAILLSRGRAARTAAPRQVGGILMRWLEDGLLVQADPSVLAPPPFDEEASE